MKSPTRKKLDEKRRRRLLTVGILDICSALAWAKVADLSVAEGKKAEGALQAALSAAYAVLGYRHIKASK